MGQMSVTGNRFDFPSAVRCRRYVIAFGITCLTSLPLHAQYRESRIVELDGQRKYADALELCIKNDDLPFAAFLAGEYYFHGRKGIPQDKKKGQTYYLKALNRLLPRAEGGDALAQYRVARCMQPFQGRERLHYF
jgi:hypothetical protein